MRKPILTKQRKAVLEKMKETQLHWGYGVIGGKEFFFADGAKPKQGVVIGMIEAGLIDYVSGILGVPTQQLERK